jgi:hypothetical protein
MAKGQLMIAKNGDMAILVPQQDGIDYADAVRRLERVKAALGQAVPITFQGGVERHVHGADGQAIRGTVDHLMPDTHKHSH